MILQTRNMLSQQRPGGAGPLNPRGLTRAAPLPIPRLCCIARPRYPSPLANGGGAPPHAPPCAPRTPLARCPALRPDGARQCPCTPQPPSLDADSRRGPASGKCGSPCSCDSETSCRKLGTGLLLLEEVERCATVGPCGIDIGAGAQQTEQALGTAFQRGDVEGSEPVLGAAPIRVHAGFEQVVNVAQLSPSRRVTQLSRTVAFVVLVP
eukprot:scaffold38291_cov58-Phaeocystis_antarctica.AAC.3